MTETAIFLLTNLFVGFVVMLYILHTQARIATLERTIQHLEAHRKRKQRHEETGIQ